MQLKCKLRTPIKELFEKMLPLEAHKRSLKNFAAERSEEFFKLFESNHERRNHAVGGGPSCW